MIMQHLTLICAMLFVTGPAAIGAAADVGSIRAQEISECRSNEQATWNDGRDRPVGSEQVRFAYNHRGAPEWFSARQASAMVARAAASWGACGVQIEVVPWQSGLGQRDLMLVTWDEQESQGNFGLANLSRRTLSLSAKAFGLLQTRNPKYDSRETLQMVISHEMGHLLGLMAHSRRCVDVLSYYDNGKGDACFSRDPGWKGRVTEYRSPLPTACDIERCRTVNGKPPLTSRRSFPE